MRKAENIRSEEETKWVLEPLVPVSWRYFVYHSHAHISSICSALIFKASSTSDHDSG
jgi:hypothetical protein